MVISDGGTVTDSSGYVGNNASGIGTVTVDGAGSLWANSSPLYVGYSGQGIVNVTSGGSLGSSAGYLGYNGGAVGVLTVEGRGSTWAISGDLYVGREGTGTLGIANGGIVTVTGTTYAGSSGNASGWLNFGDSGGTLTTTIFAGPSSQVLGTGAMNVRGIYSDDILLFDAAHGANQTLAWINDRQNVSVHLDLSGASGAVSNLVIGFESAGTMTIRDGVVVKSTEDISVTATMVRGGR